MGLLEVEFDAKRILAVGGISEQGAEHVTRAQDLIRGLPAGTPPAVVRQIVEAAFRAFDVPLASILDSAEAEIQSFDAFIETTEGELVARKTYGEERIAELETEIRSIRDIIKQSQQRQQLLSSAAKAEITKVQAVLDFFEAGL